MVSNDDTRFVLVLGGAGSGKSVFAEELVASVLGRHIYIATASAGDEEMRERIEAHCRRRGDSWHTIEEERRVEEALSHAGTEPVLVDCLTLWISNLLADAMSDDEIQREADRLAAASAARAALTVLVSNEVGCGIVPDNALARRFRDLQGRVNRTMAKAADEVYLVTAGIEQRIK